MATVTFDVTDPCERLAHLYISELRALALEPPLCDKVYALHTKTDLLAFIDDVLDDARFVAGANLTGVALAEWCDLLLDMRDTMCTQVHGSVPRCLSCIYGLEQIAVDELSSLFDTAGFVDAFHLVRIDDVPLSLLVPDNRGPDLDLLMTCGWASAEPACKVSVGTPTGVRTVEATTIEVVRENLSGRTDMMTITMLDPELERFVFALNDGSASIIDEELAQVVDAVRLHAVAVDDDRFVGFAADAIGEHETTAAVLEDLHELLRIWDVAVSFDAVDIACDVAGTCPPDQIPALLRRLHPAA